MLAPLTKITPNKRKFKWTKSERDSFNEIMRIVDRDTLLTYTYFNETFKMHTNPSNLQLGAEINQEGKHITFYSRKLNDYQKRYTVTERELLSIIETLKLIFQPRSGTDPILSFVGSV